MIERLQDKAVAAGLAATFLVAGCHNGIEAPSAGPGVVHEYGTSVPLPSDIGRAVLATVRVVTEGESLTYKYPNGHAIGTWFVREVTGSGTDLTPGGELPQIVNTAAHLVANTNGHCRDTSVTFPAGPSYPSGKTKPAFNSSAILQTPVAPYSRWSSSYNDGLDDAVLWLDNNSYGGVLPAQKRVDVKPSQLVFSVGYQQSRDPEAKDPKNRSPAITPSEVVAVDKTDGVVTVITGFGADSKDYPVANSIVPGDSGSTVVNQGGHYLGDLVSGDLNSDGTAEQYTGLQLEAQFGYKLPDSYKFRKFGRAFFRIITAGTLTNLWNKSQHTSCTTAPAKVVTVPEGTDPKTLPRKQDYQRVA